MRETKPSQWNVLLDEKEHQPPNFSCAEVVVDGPIALVIARVDPQNEWPQKAEEHARLIAAAPELVEALEGLVAANNILNRKPLPPAIRKARDVLAKVKEA